jgi:uncharacterized membrane protein
MSEKPTKVSDAINNLPNWANYSLHVGRVIMGAVFVFSGFVKAIDPLGSTYKFEDYFHSFGGVFLSFVPLAFTFSVLLSTFEFALGLALLVNVRKELTYTLSVLFMSFMTPLTLYIAIKNPVSDCGCFGDAWVITNWQTFFKNLIFITITIFLFVNRKRLSTPFKNPVVEWLLLGAFALSGIGISIHCFNHLPYIDFLPFKVGADIKKGMEIPDGAPADKYETTFVYEKSGKQQEFTLENYPKGDPSWKFVDQKTKLVQKGYEPPIHDFTIIDSDGNDLTQEVLNHDGDTYLLIMYDLSKTSEEGARKAELVYQKALEKDQHFYALTASSDDSIQSFIQRTEVSFPFYKTDPTALKTVIRANPGLILINKGVVKAKWNWRDFPEYFQN